MNENGKERVVKKIEVLAKQVMNKVATGSIQSQHLAFKYLQQAEEKAAELSEDAEVPDCKS